MAGSLNDHVPHEAAQLAVAVLRLAVDGEFAACERLLHEQPHELLVGLTSYFAGAVLGWLQREAEHDDVNIDRVLGTLGLLVAQRRVGTGDE